MILVIDNYDSFTFNLVQALQAAGANVRVVRNDAITAAELDALATDPAEYAHWGLHVVSVDPPGLAHAGQRIELQDRALGRSFPRTPAVGWAKARGRNSTRGQNRSRAVPTRNRHQAILPTLRPFAGTNGHDGYALTQSPTRPSNIARAFSRMRSNRARSASLMPCASFPVCTVPPTTMS